ncbi:putative lipoprotein [Desulfamplus magnetovallimortis]|uniref:Putative lipoprotein n=1 Tax=Desulfamplus magnetovallimortis TaxID=1246637 RepID=A0A1W1HD29_9BACT|nr:hypothetical protein [Desulfamplus magnetovallimortis]SLM30346.1 putative lipoprotein [Desulfamplus magnetovallimortis]
MDLSTKKINAVIMVLFSLVFFSGCSSNMAADKNSRTSATPSPAVSREPTALYYDFDDVLVPKDLAVVNESTVVVSTPGYTSGILTLKGRIEINSLFNFFNNNMQKDNWDVVSQIKSPASTIMIFHKSSRWAVITLREKEFYTYAEIGVAPAVAETVPGVQPLGESTLFE